MNRPDKIVRALALLVWLAYFGTWVGGVAVLVGAPALKVFAPGSPDWKWGVTVPGVTLTVDEAERAPWGAGRLQVEDVQGTLRLPVSTLPWWLFAVLWVHTAVLFTLMLAFLSRLRKVVRRIRAAAAFHVENARCLRSLGILLFALAFLDGVAGSVVSWALSRGFTSSTMSVSTGLHVNGALVLLGLILIVLAEIFRRGSALEQEQALVI